MLMILTVSAVTGAVASVLLSDDFSGTAGESLVGTSLDTGGVWSDAQTDGTGSLNGNYVFAAGGGVVAENDIAASVFTALPETAGVQCLTNGIELSITFSPGAYDGLAMAMGLAEEVDKGHFINLSSGDVIRIIYYTAGTYAGRFRWMIYESGELIDNSFSTLLGSVPENSNDLIRLSITCYPSSGIAVGEAYNVDGDTLISRSGTYWNSPGLTNLQYTGMGMSGFSVSDTNAPAVVRSFQVTSENLAESRPLAAFSEAELPVMTGFAFQDMGSLADTNFPTILSEHAPIDIMHSVRSTVYDTVRATYPDKLIINQLAWGGNAGLPLSSYWPGHCLLKAGTKLTADCGATTNDTVLYLQDYTRIAGSQASIDNVTDPEKHLVLYALGSDGKPDWSRSEHVKMVSINTGTGALTVERGQQGTVPLAYTNGLAAVARHMMFWSNQWQANFSLECPRGGPFNMTAAEWFAVMMAQQIVTRDADGIEFDVARWQWGYPANNPMDCDNDLVADYGYIGGINSFGLGGQVMLKKLRELLGPDRIIQADGNDALYGQRGWKYMNGVQMESFPMANKFDRFSQAFHHLRQWVAEVEQPVAFSYPFSKTTSTLYGNVFDEGGGSVDWHFRVGFAAALLTGMPHPFASITDINFDPDDPEANSEELVEDKGFYKWDEYVGGDLNDWKWLGPPQGDALQNSDNQGATDLLASAVWQWETETGFVADCTSSNGEYTAVITGLPSNTIPWTSASYPGTDVPQALWFGTRLEIASGAPVLVPGQEYTLEFEAKGNDSWSAGGQIFEKVPRSLAIHGVADYGYDNPASVFLGPEWTTCRFSMIADSSAPPPLVFGFSEQIGEASVRNVHLYSGCPERWTREFKYGRVYLNMTQDPWTVDVGSGVAQRLAGTQYIDLNNGAVVNGVLTVPSWDAVFLRTGTFDAWQSGQFSLEVSDDFSTGFDGREEGGTLAGHLVQNGLGIWSNVYTSGSDSMAGNMTLTSGGLTESAGGGGGVYVELPGQSETVSIEIVLTPNDFSSGSFSVGFAEIVDKGYFSNLSQGDVLRARYIPSGVNAGRFEFAIYNDGVSVYSAYSGRTGSEALNTNDAVKLMLSYNMTSGSVTGTAFNVSGDYELTSQSLTIPGLTNMIYAGFGWTGIPDQDVAGGGPSDTPGIVSSFRAGDSAVMLDELIRGEDADPDEDGFSNLQEYVVGSNPFDAQSLFSFSSQMDGSGSVLNWLPVSGRSYDVYWSSNLFSAFVPVEEDLVWPQSAYTNSIPADAKSGFYQIRVRR
jgi:hypothetical protein